MVCLLGWTEPAPCSFRTLKPLYRAIASATLAPYQTVADAASTLATQAKVCVCVGGGSWGVPHTARAIDADLPSLDRSMHASGHAPHAP
jgi:hypothetical protein